MKKHVYTLLGLALMVLLLCVLPLNVQASEVVDSGTCGENLTWTLDSEGTLTISGTGDLLSASWSEHKEQIIFAEIERGVTGVGDYVFFLHSRLTSVMIPDSVTSIGAGAFAYCTSLAEVTIPSSVNSIGGDAFLGCDNVTRFDVDENNGAYYSDDRGVLYNKEQTVLIKAPQTLDGDYNVFSGVVTIVNDAFSNCENLSGIMIPNSVAYIGEWAFSNCSSITAVVIPEGVARIEKGTFDNCSSLCDVTIPESVTSIDGYAFRECDALKSIEIPNSVTAIGEYAFACSGLSSITIPDGVTCISEGMLSQCLSLVDVKLPDSVVTIEKSAFHYCVAIKRLTIPDSVTRIGDNGFAGCEELIRIELSNSITSIGQSAFAYCENLTEVRIPERVDAIEEYTFFNCTALRSITMPDSIKSIGNNAFAWCDVLDNVIIPPSVTTIGEHAFAYCESMKSVSLPPKLESIGEYAFINCVSLSSVRVPGSVTDIGKYAFYNCHSLSDVTILAGISRISEYAFAGCSALTDIILPATIKVIGGMAFADCTALTDIVFEGEAPRIVSEPIYGVGKLDYPVFCNVIATVYYPAGDITWTAELMQECGGTLNWIPCYEIISGANAIVDISQNKGVAIRINGEYARFVGVSINDITVNSANYTVTEGSTVILFNSDYLKMLGEGVYTVKIYFNGGVAVTRMTVCAHAEKIQIAAKKSSCTQTGNEMYYICDSCGLAFKADGITETTVEGETTPATNHTFGLWRIGTESVFGVSAGTKYRSCKCGYTEHASYTTPLTDVPNGKYYSKPVFWAYENGITKGKTATEFQLDADCTRKQIVMFLWRAAGEPEPRNMENPFADVKADSFQKAILWAYYEGITSGKTATEFQPEAPCIREQIVMFLWRYFGKPEPQSMNNPFTDVKVGGTFEKAILWAYYEGITTGKTATTFEPQATCTRGQIVTFLYRSMVE